MRKLPVIKYAVVALLGALLFGFIYALPWFNAPVGPDILISAARGVAAQEEFSGFNSPSFGDVMAGRLWRMGGANLLAWGHWAGIFLGWTTGAFVAIFLVASVMSTAARRVRWIVFPLTALLLAGLCVRSVKETFLHRHEKAASLELVAPVKLTSEAASLEGKGVFASPSALSALVLFAPQLVEKDAATTAGRLSQDVPAWRQASRQRNWETVLLSGPLQEYRPLLNHLLESPDWYLATVNNQGYLFRRGTGTPAQPLDVDKFRLGNDTETAIYLAQVAGYYDAIRQSTAARNCLEAAKDLAPKNLTVLSHAASFAAARRQWQEAISLSDQALKIEPASTHAMVVKAMALLETRQPTSAQYLLEDALAQTPDDIYTLFLLARVYRAQNDYVRESETLEKIIAVAGPEAPTNAHYYIYLGQAYARQGRAKEALKSYESAIKTGRLSPREIDEVKATIESVKSNAGN